MYVGFKILPANPPAVARAKRLPRVPEPVLIVEGTLGCKPYAARIIGPHPIYGVERVFLGRKATVGDPSEFAVPGTGLRIQVVVSLAGLNDVEILELRGGMTGDDYNAAGEALKAFFEFQRMQANGGWIASLRAVKLQSWSAPPPPIPTFSYIPGGDWFRLRPEGERLPGDPPEGRELSIVKIQGAESRARARTGSGEEMVELLAAEIRQTPEAIRRQIETIRRQAVIIERLTAEAKKKGLVLPTEPEDETPGKRIIDMAE